MFGIGPGEAILILFVAILFIRPEDLPKIVREIGKLYGELQRWIDVLKDEINSLDSH